jgi:hypothetical protein
VKSELEARLQANIDRVRGLVLLYGRAAPGRGRSDVSSTDLLRAAVTFLHASCEDLIRGVTSWKLPRIANVDRLAELPLGGVASDDRPGPIKFDLQLLAEHHRQRTVQDIIGISVEEALERSTFNNPPELHRALDRLDLAGPWLGPHKRSLVPLMMRRHWIVHRLDRNRSSGRGQHVARSLARSTVERWTKAVEDFGRDLLSRC